MIDLSKSVIDLLEIARMGLELAELQLTRGEGMDSNDYGKLLLQKARALRDKAKSS
jgi:hypothetical protein